MSLTGERGGTGHDTNVGERRPQTVIDDDRGIASGSPTRDTRRRDRLPIPAAR
jgi:hypothetical protein